MKSSSILSRSSFHFILILGFFLVVFLGDFLGLFENQELGFVDLRFRLRPPRLPHSDIVVVEIDDESISRLGHWPWPRGYHANLINTLSSYHPRLILYDVLFIEASTDSLEDTLLAQAFQKAGNVIAPFFFQFEKPFVAFFPIEPFRNAARYLGYANIFPDPDARIRRLRLNIRPEGKSYYHTSAVAALAQFQSEGQAEAWLKRIPVDSSHSFWINYPGEFSLFHRVPFGRILEDRGVNEEELKRLFEGKLVIVGHTATGSGDFRPTPFSPAYPGIGIQASALHTLLTGDYLRRFQGGVSLIILLTASLWVTLLTRKNTPLMGLVATAVLAGFYLVWNFLLFNFFGWILPVFPVLLVILGTYLLTLFLQFIRVQFEAGLLARELSLAAQIQENFLPQTLPKMEGVDLSFYCRFARTVGGDLYDWVSLDEDRVALFIGDVSGKGIPAALYMARAISELRSLAKNFDSPSAFLEALNRGLIAAGVAGIFVTLFCLIVDTRRRQIHFSNAGHEPLFHYRSRTHTGEWIRKGAAPPLGLFEETRYADATLAVEEGDTLLLMSDGVRELHNPRGEEFGYQGVETALPALKGQSALETIRGLFRAMDEFAKGNAAHDDRTLVCVRMGKKP